MDQLTINAAGGMRSIAESLDILANNLANTGTIGYKADGEFYDLYWSQQASADPISQLPVIERNWIDLKQGILKDTGQPLDVGLTGNGFFMADGPSGPLLTRNGSFRLSRQGRLETQEGFPVRIVDPAGSQRPLQIGVNALVEIERDGTIRVDGQPRGRLDVVDCEAPYAVSKQGANYFRLSDTAKLKRGSAEVRQGALEASNVGPAESAVRLVSVLRHFEMLQKALVLGGEMNRRAVEEVARVSG
ncbi:MAG: flagellar hook-basal body protein [Bryobacteraceae bacterium]